MNEIIADLVYETEIIATWTRCADYEISFYSQTLSLTSPTSSGRPVGIVRLLTKRHGVYLIGN
jgi:hypothetical protein